MPTTRKLALEGCLMSAVYMIRKGYDDSRIFDRVSERCPGGTRAQYLAIIKLAHQGVAYADSIDWTDSENPLDLSGAPRLPR